MRIGLVGGGSGGHFYPLIAVAEILNQHPEKPELFYFGPSPYNEGDLAIHDITYIYCPAGKLRRYFTVANFIDMLKLPMGIIVAIVKLYIYYPDVIFSKGSYTSVPILCAARLLRIPVVIHESDVKPGRANKYAGKFAKYIAISWPETAEFFPPERTALTGIPIREALLSTVEQPHQKLGIDPSLPLIYVTGGSLGSERINTLILNSLNELLPHVQIFHQTGPTHEAGTTTTAKELLAEQPELLNRYYVIGLANAETIKTVLDATQIVITRAGSTSLFEIAHHAVPAIVIPIPEEISHDQRSNAYAYARTGAGIVIEEQNLTEHILQTEVLSLLQDQERYQTMKSSTQNFTATAAAETIALSLISIGHEHGS